MLKLAPVEIQNFKDVYEDMLEQFPACEMKDYNTFINLFEQGQYKLLSVVDDNVRIGYLLLYESSVENVLWLDYIAVFRQYQSKGYGRMIFDSLINQFNTYKGIYLEVEKADESVINTIRRIKFYKSLGAKKLDINYFYPNKDGCIDLDLYFLPFCKAELPLKEVSFRVIKDVFNALHKELNHIDNVYCKITGQY